MKQIAGFGFAILCLGCRPAPPMPAAPPAGDAWFADVTERSGIDFCHFSPHGGKFFMPEIVGSGAALFDFDLDGRLDVYLLQNSGPGSATSNRLFHQDSAGRFVDASPGSGLDVSGYAMGTAAGDIDNDGFPDVVVAEYGAVRLFLNRRDGTFREMTGAGIDNPGWAVAAALFDYDRDGWLDLVVANYVDYIASARCFDKSGKPDYCGPTAFQGSASRLFHNLAKRAGEPRFEDVTLPSGLSASPGAGLGVVCADFDGDHWSDVFVTNDAQPNHLWINRHDGSFAEEAAVRGIAYNAAGIAQANMGIGLADVDGNGLFDIYVTHLTEETNVLWLQGPRGFFQDQTAQAGLSAPRERGTGFGTALADFDQDGAIDLAVVNGRVRRPVITDKQDPAPAGEASPWSEYAEHNQLFAGSASGKFRDISEHNGPFCSPPGVGRGLAIGDLDGDGALDLLATYVAGQARLYRNAAPRRGHWLLVRAVDPALGGRDAFGAEVTVRVGDRRRTAWLCPSTSYACANDPRLHFGLGGVESVDAFEVVWPDGSRETFPAAPADCVCELRKGKGNALPLDVGRKRSH